MSLVLSEIMKTKGVVGIVKPVHMAPCRNKPNVLNVPLVHTLMYKVLHQILHAQSVLEGCMLQHQALENVLTVLQAVFAMKLDFLSTENALLENTRTSSRDGTATTARLVATRIARGRPSALSVRLVLSTMRQVP